MKLKRLLVVAVAGAFALPLAAQASADSDRMILAQAGGASAVGTGPTGGVPSTQSAGEPSAPNDPKAEQRRCESMTGAQRESCMRDARAGTTSSGSSVGTTSGSSVGTAGSATGGASSAPAGQTGTTAGPGEASPKVGTGSDTATSSSTSGTGKAQ